MQTIQPTTDQEIQSLIMQLDWTIKGILKRIPVVKINPNIDQEIEALILELS